MTIAERYAAERQRFVAIGRQLYELESLLGHDRAQVGPGRCQRCDKIQPPSGASSASSASLLPASTSHPPSDAPAPADAKILPSLAEFASPRTLCCNVCEWILAHLSLKRQEFVHSYREVQRFQQALEPTSGSLSPPLRSISAPLQHSTFSSTGTGRSPFVISSSSPELPHSPSSPHQSSSGGMIHSRLFPPKGPLLWVFIWGTICCIFLFNYRNSRLFTNY